MKKYASILLTASLIMAAPVSGHAQTTQRLAATKANDYALVYSLPTTRLTVTQQGIPNPDERYAVQFKSGTDPFMILSNNGIPLAINTEKTMPSEQPQLPEPQAAKPTPLETPAARQVVSEEMAQSQSTAKRAELAAASLFAIRQTRSDLITGQAEQTPPDGKSLQLMLDNLEAQEQALMAMFIGTTSTRTDVSSFSLVPDDNITDMVIARISPLDGIVDAEDLSGEPVYLNLKVTQRGEMPENEKGVRLTFPKNGLAYCIPGTAEVNITYRGDTYFENDEEMAQFGVVYGLAPNSFTDRKAPIYVIFNPATGAIASQGPAQP